MTRPRHLMPRYDEKREQHLTETVLHGAQSLPEQKEAWYGHLKSHLTFPFVATYHGQSGVRRFASTAKLQVIGMARPELCKDTLQVRVMDGQGSVPVPLTCLSVSDTDPSAALLSDWQYWHKRYGEDSEGS